MKGVSVLSKERLTERFSNGQVAVKGCGANCNYGYEYCVNHVEDCPTIIEVYDKLAEYEDLEEQGLLLRLPCKVGDTVWVVVEVYTFGETEDDSDSWYTIYTTKFGLNMLDMFGKTVFLTQSEAEEKLRELEGK